MNCHTHTESDRKEPNGNRTDSLITYGYLDIDTDTARLIYNYLMLEFVFGTNIRFSDFFLSEARSI